MGLSGQKTLHAGELVGSIAKLDNADAVLPAGQNNFLIVLGGIHQHNRHVDAHPIQICLYSRTQFGIQIIVLHVNGGGKSVLVPCLG